MKLKMTIILIGLLFLSNFTNQIRWDIDPQPQNKAITIRHFECSGQNYSETFCKESIQIILNENSTGEITSQINLFGARIAAFPEEPSRRKDLPAGSLIC